MARPSLSAKPRTEFGKNACRRIRAAGRVPAILYGLEEEPVALSVDHHDFNVLLAHEAGATIIDLAPEGADAPTPVIVREVLDHPVTSQRLHVDFQRIDLTVETTFTVDIVGVGIPHGVKEGGVLDTITRAVEVVCLPSNLPHTIDVDITDLGFHQSLHASDLAMPEGVRLHSDPDTVLFTVLAPRGLTAEEEEAEAAAMAEEEGAEPEVVGEKKEDEAEGQQDAEG